MDGRTEFWWGNLRERIYVVIFTDGIAFFFADYDYRVAFN